MNKNLKEVLLGALFGGVVCIFLQLPLSSSCQAKFWFSKSSLAVEMAQQSGIRVSVLEMALKAHQKAYQQGITKSKLMTLIDYSLPSKTKRLWVLDLDKKKVVYHTHVAHGSGSGLGEAIKFSNRPGSYQSSLGLFLTGHTYQGKNGLSLRLHGLEPGVNHNAYQRAIVMHPAHYVSDSFVKQHGRLGRSWGCPAVSYADSRPIINTIKEGVLIFAYYPDHAWMKASKFIG